MATLIRYIDLYTPTDDKEAAVIENLLSDFDIDCNVKPTGIIKKKTQPGEKNLSHEKVISVEEDSVETARRIITDAQKKGIISKNGSFKVQAKSRQSPDKA